MEWLIATLAAPIASFGENGGNTIRKTSDRPTRSAMLGLAGAALGVKRDDREGQRRLHGSFRISTLTLSAGNLMRDYHTFRSLPSDKCKPCPPFTRGEALERPGVVVDITERYYRADVCYLVAYQALPDGWIGLRELREALDRPKYFLYLGRRSCSLSHPLLPECVGGETVVEAFSQYCQDRQALWDQANESSDLKPWQYGESVYQRFCLKGRDCLVAVESKDALGAVGGVMAVQRMDDPLDRDRWHFRQRTEYQFVVGADTFLPQTDKECDG